MRLRLDPAALQGSIAAIPSKSQAHRLLLCAALAEAPTELLCPAVSQDMEATASCLRALGADVRYENGAYRVSPIPAPPASAVLSCGESGSTLRFLLPVCAALGVEAEFLLRGRLGSRPLSPLRETLENHGIRLEQPERNRLRCSGRLQGGDFSLAGDVSSQFLSGLLLALPLLREECSLSPAGSLESAGYLAMTREAQAQFGLFWKSDSGRFLVGERWRLPLGSRYRSPGTLAVEGDWSNAAFWLVADALRPGLRCTGLNPASQQGDRAVVEAIRRIQAGGGVIDGTDIPDLIPPLAVLAAATPGETRFIHAARLRLKESDRLRSITALLRELGANVEEREDGLCIRGGRLLGGRADSAGDHRIAMSAAIAATVCEGSVLLDGAEAVEKSYPGFWQDYAALGGRIGAEA